MHGRVVLLFLSVVWGSIWAADFHQDLLPQLQKHCWDCHNARKAKGESIRVFPISNWTELDIWSFIAEYNIDLPSIYYAHRRPVFRRDNMWMAVTPFLQPEANETVVEEMVRFRTVGDATCTAAIESVATTVEDIIAETSVARVTERGATRADDRMSEAGMEDRKRTGYF